MKQLINALIIVATLVSPLAVANDVSVAVVDFARLQTEAPQSIKARERIDAEFAPRQAKIEAQERQIAQLEETLRQKDGISELEMKSLQRDVRSRTLRLENAREELESDRRLRASEESDRLRRVVAEVIAQVALQENVDVVLETGVVTWASPRANITDKVLKRMQQLAEGAK